MTHSLRKQKLIRMTSLGVLIGIIVVLHMLAGPLSEALGTPVSLVLIPIALGAMVFGPLAGAFLGLFAGVMIFVTYGVMGLDPLFTAILFQNHPVLTFFVCVVKTTVAGYIAGWAYRLIEKKNSLVATVLASASVPVLNTSLFILGCFTMVDTFQENFLAGQNMLYYILMTFVVKNFLLEFSLNMIFSSAIHRVVLVVKRMLEEKK